MQCKKMEEEYKYEKGSWDIETAVWHRSRSQLKIAFCRPCCCPNVLTAGWNWSWRTDQSRQRERVQSMQVEFNFKRTTIQRGSSTLSREEIYFYICARYCERISLLWRLLTLWRWNKSTRCSPAVDLFSFCVCVWPIGERGSVCWGYIGPLRGLLWPQSSLSNIPLRFDFQLHSEMEKQPYKYIQLCFERWRELYTHTASFFSSCPSVTPRKRRKHLRSDMRFRFSLSPLYSLV